MINEHGQRALIVFVKNPVQGQVKTRLGKEIGMEEALKVYLLLLAYTRSVCTEVDADIHVFFSNHIPEQTEWAALSQGLHVQRGDDLGTKMTTAFEEMYQRYEHVAIIGSDCPGLKPEYIEQGFQAISKGQYAIGPAEDGGYYLFGAPRTAILPFKGIEWSSKHVLRQTLDQIESTDFEATQLPILRDLDTLEDLEASNLDY